ncbi:MAG TPA: flavin reductase family protein [Candidatus Binatia bacterium]|nr:flavin reductase family protein [Candidatus Binatia bacterium]
MVSDQAQSSLVTCRGRTDVLGRPQERHDIVATKRHIAASDAPPLYAIFIPARFDFPLSLIRSSGVFCVNRLSEERHGEVAFCTRHAGDHLDKFQETGLTLAECETIDCPRIAEAVAYLECELVEEKAVGDHVLFVGKVLRSVSPQS